MTSVGKQLRSAREERKRSIAEIAGELCITERYLRALEEDDLTGLPGVFFYKSFVRQYAAILDVDPARLQPGIEALCPPPEASAAAAPVRDPRAARFVRPFALLRTAQGGVAAARVAPQNVPQPVRQPEPLLQDFNRYMSDRRVGVSAAGLVGVLLVCSGFYSWWTKTPAAASPRAVAHQPSAVLTPVGNSTSVLQHAELDVSATETTWLSITANGKEIFSGVLQPSQTKTLTGVEGAQMRIGNAGGIEVRWKGKPIGPFGPSGQVRTVQLTEDNFKIIAPEPVSSDPAL